MMNAEEEDLDIDLNNEDDNHNSDVCVAQAVPDISPVSPPITPIYYQNLLNDDGGRNTDDDMKKFDSLSSDSSVSEPTVKRTPYGVQISKRAAAAGLFKSDKKGDLFAAVVASEGKISNNPTPAEPGSATTHMTVPSTVLVEPVSTTTSNVTTTTPNETGARSAVKCLFPDDKNGDDFLTAPASDSVTPLHGVKPSEPVPSPVYTLTNNMSEFNINDSNTISNTPQGPNYQFSNNSPNMYGGQTPLQSGTPVITSVSANTFSPFAFQPREVEVQKPNLNGSHFANTNVNSGTTDLNSSLNRNQYVIGSENSIPHIRSYPGSNGLVNNPNSKSTNNSTVTTPIQPSDHPFLYNPSSFPSSDMVGGNLQNNLTKIQNSNKVPVSHYNSQNRLPNYHANLQFSSVNAASNETEKSKDDSPLFIPQMYSTAQPMSSSSFFVPQQVNDSNLTEPSHLLTAPLLSHQNPPPSHPTPPSSHGYPPPHGTTPSSNTYVPPLNPPPHSFPTNHVSSATSPPSYNDCVLHDNNTMYDISPPGHKHGGNNAEKGIFAWLKGTVTKDWSTGAHTFKQYVKTATDSVLTTLDPGMRDYLSPGLHLHTTSQNGQSVPIMVGMKEGFRIALHSEPTIQVHSMNNTASPLLPIGFEGALQTISNQLEYLRSVQQESSRDQVMVASQVFLTELVSGNWYVMFCFGLEDTSKDIHLHTFSQPVPLPIGCITSAYNNMLHNERGECIGYTKTIDDIVRSHVHYEKDWCLALAGAPLHQILTTAVQCLALDYQRHVTAKNNSTQQVANNYQNYSNNTTTTTTTTNYYPQHNNQHQNNQYGLNIDAIS